MSLESAMDEERREVMNLLEGRPPGYGNARSPPPAPIRTGSPAAPVRSMLDIGPAVTRHASIAGIGTGVTPGPFRSAPLVGSMLDPYAEAPPRPLPEQPKASPPDDSRAASGDLHRAMSDASSSPRRRPHAGSDSSPNMPYSRDQFDMSSTVSGPARPKRVTQGGRRGRSSMAAIVRGQELDTVAIGKNHEKHMLGSSSSKSPSRRKSRSDSPANSMLNTNSFNPMPMPGKFVSETGKVIDLKNAYRKLSDAHIIKSGSSLSSYGTKDQATRARLGSGETLSPDGEVRLAKDYYDKDDEDAIESSDEAGSSDDDTTRGRQRSRPESSDEETTKPNGRKDAGSRKSAQSLLAAAEEERLSVSSKYKVKSLLEPTVTVTGPGGEKISVKKTGVHPNTSYNAQLSRSGSPASDSEDMSDIRRAQRLSINLSQVDTGKKHTAIRTIVRGEFSSIQKEGEEGMRRLRNYLVATDLSSEAAYALEWTIGTVLRDGDTILAIYAIDGGDAIGKPGDTDSAPGVEIGEGGKAIQESAAAIGRLTEASKSSAAVRFHSPLNALGAEQRGSRPSSVDTRSLPKLEKERMDAIHEITQTCLKFLRKTKLQVRIAIEVIHCKSPKNLITEAVRHSPLMS